MWFLLLLAIFAALVFGCYRLIGAQDDADFSERTRQLHGEALTPLETLMDAEDTTQGRLLAALMTHDVLLAMEPPVHDPERSVPLRLNDGTGDYLLVAASQGIADQFGEAVESQGGGSSPFAFVARLSGATLVEEPIPEVVGIRMLGRSQSGNFNAIVIEASTLSEVRETAYRLSQGMEPLEERGN